MEVSTKNEAERKKSSVDEEVKRDQESKGTSHWRYHASAMEGEFVVCEQTEEVGKEQSARVDAPPQKRREVVREESAETHDYASEPPGLEESDAEEIEEFSFIPSAVSEPRWALPMCDQMQ